MKPIEEMTRTELLEELKKVSKLDYSNEKKFNLQQKLGWIKGRSFSPVVDFDSVTQEGISVRDWFAGNAMKGIISAEGYPNSRGQLENCCKTAYDFADEMLKAGEY